MEFDNDFPRRIAMTRAALGMTQAELASHVGVVQRQVAAYEGGESRPRQGALLKLAEALGTSPAWLANGTGDAPNPRKLSPFKTVRQIPVIAFDDVVKWLFDDGKNENLIIELHPTSCLVSNLAFAVRINDSAMVTGNTYGYGFPPGSLVTFDPAISPEDQDFVLAIFEDGKITFRQMFTDMYKTSLIPMDSRYSDYEVDTRDGFDDDEVVLAPQLISAVFVEVSLPALSRVEISGIYQQITQKAEYPSLSAYKDETNE
ncbi:helix-turn-helix domain-containing protein [Yersinia wautersii]|nr:LexA family transcriptional regulator [Yersinia pseudotuberculosis]